MLFNDRRSVLVSLGFQEEKLPLLETFVDFLWSSNQELNLFSRQMTFAELIDNHVIDCLLPLSFFPTNLKEVADFGSGGGLPGVIYALQFPQLSFHLYEKSVLKQRFLNRCKEFTPNINVNGEIPPSLPSIDLVMARAFKPLDIILDVSREFYKKSGKYFLLKGRKEKIEEEVKEANKKFRGLSLQIKPLSSPVLEVERHLVLIH